MENEDQGALGGDPEEGWQDEPDGDGLRGWIPPDDRLWRHPSESMAASPRPPAAAGPPTALANRTHTRFWIIGGTTAFLVVALISAGLVMSTTDNATSGSSGSVGTVSLIGAPTTDPGVHPVAGANTVAAMVSAVRSSTVALSIEGPHGVVDTTGLVAESGGIIVTTARSLAGAHSITATEPDGSRHRATLVGTDATSGLGVVRIDDDMPAATFDSADLAIGQVAVAAALTPSRRADQAPSSTIYAGTVLSAGQALGADAVTDDFSATAIEAPLSDDDLGCPLVNTGGQVSGMLETTKGDGTSTMAVFLPAELVLGVTRQIVSSGSVDPGWLGVDTSDADSDTTPTTSGTVVASASDAYGARLDAIDSDSPAADAGLAPGDVITGVDGQSVQSAAELRTRLYADPPGTDLAITYEQAGATLTTSVTLSDKDTDAPGGDSSP